MSVRKSRTSASSTGDDLFQSGSNFKVVIRARPPLPRELNGERPFQNVVSVSKNDDQTITISGCHSAHPRRRSSARWVRPAPFITTRCRPTSPTHPTHQPARRPLPQATRPPHPQSRRLPRPIHYSPPYSPTHFPREPFGRAGRGWHGGHQRHALRDSRLHVRPCLRPELDAGGGVREHGARRGE